RRPWPALAARIFHLKHSLLEPRPVARALEARLWARAQPRRRMRSSSGAEEWSATGARPDQRRVGSSLRRWREVESTLDEPHRSAAFRRAWLAEADLSAAPALSFRDARAIRHVTPQVRPEAGLRSVAAREPARARAAGAGEARVLRARVRVRGARVRVRGAR